MTETRRFPLRTLLSVTTGRLLTRRHGDNGFGVLCEFLAWMTGDSPHAYQLSPLAAEYRPWLLSRLVAEYRPWLLRWFPEMARADEKIPTLDWIAAALTADPRNALLDYTVQGWVEIVRDTCNLAAEYDVPRIPPGEPLR